MRRLALLPLALTALLGASVAVLPAVAAAPAEAKLEVNKNCVDPNWPCWVVPGSGSNPKPASRIVIAQGGEVAFTDNSTAANIAWTGVPPTCSAGVPVSPAAAATGWEGKCKFEQPGTYKFESSQMFNEGGINYTKYEIVVEAASSGITMTTTTTTTSSTTPMGPSAGSPFEGSKALKLAASQRGPKVRGSIKVSAAGSGGRLEVALFAAGASLARARHAVPVRVGRLVRSSLKTGSATFSVPLNARGTTSLRRHRRLVLTAKITLTPLHGAPLKVARVVVLHA
jgi:hypothetical protein